MRPKRNRLVAKSEVALPGQDQEDLVIHDHALGDIEVRPAAAMCDANQGIDSFERKRVHTMRRRHLLGSEPPDVQLDSLVFARLLHAHARIHGARERVSRFRDVQSWQEQITICRFGVHPTKVTARPSE